MMENVNNKNLTVSDLINILDKEYNRRTSNGTERLLMIQVNGKCFGYLKSVKLDGYGSGLIADVCLELDTEKNDGWIPVEEPPKKDYISVFAVDKHDYYFVAVYDKEHGYRTNDVGADVDNIVSYCLFNPYRPERSEGE